MNGCKRFADMDKHTNQHPPSNLARVHRVYEDLTSDMHSDIKYCRRCAPNTLVPISAMFSWVGTDLIATLFCTCTSSLTNDTSTLTALRALTTRFAPVSLSMLS